MPMSVTASENHLIDIMGIGGKHIRYGCPWLTALG
jgi:hypothetical protein